MTDITIIKRNNYIVEVNCSGHTGYAGKGEDIVCAALSAIVQTALLGLLSVVGINVNYKVNEDKGQLHFSLPSGLSEANKQKAGIVLDTMLCGLSDIKTEYSDFFNLEVKDVY